jgi:hypothetical protein
MKKIIFFVALITESFIANSQLPKFQWAKGFGAITYAYSISVALDSFGNVYALGQFTETVDFDPGPGFYNLTSNGEHDIFISKLDSNGNFVWAKSIGGTKDDFGRSIKLDEAGNIYIIGTFGDSVDFNPNPSIKYILKTKGMSDVFISKLDITGDFVLAKQVGSKRSEGAASIAIDKLGNIFITGTFNDTCDFDPGTRFYNLISVNKYTYDFFILKLDIDGTFIWAKQIGGYSQSLTLDKSNNIYVTGGFYRTSDFNPGTATYYLTSNADSNGNYYSDIFILKLDTDGDFVWAKKIGGIYSDVGRSISLDEQNNLYIIGEFASPTDFNPGSGIFNLAPKDYDEILAQNQGGIINWFILKLNVLGNYIWVKSNVSSVSSLALDKFNNIYITGAFEKTVDFDLGPRVHKITAMNSDAYISKLDSYGNFIWAKNIASNMESYSLGLSIEIDKYGNIITSGIFKGVVDFDGGDESFILDKRQGEALFIHKMSITNNLESNGITIYPNPTNDFINIISKPTTNGIIEIYNSTGKLVIKEPIAKELNSIDLTNQADGLYFLKLISNGQILTLQKIIKI